MIKRMLLLLLIASTIPAFAADTPMHITAAEWAQPRSGEVLLRHPALTQAVQGLQANPAAVLEIRYPGGDNGTLWARELQAWLVALGVESARIRLLPGSEAADQIQLRIR